MVRFTLILIIFLVLKSVEGVAHHGNYSGVHLKKSVLKDVENYINQNV